MKYTFTIEAPTLEELIDKVERELLVITKEEELAVEHDRRMKTKIRSTKRKNKPWKESDILFLIENYRKKDMNWIAAALKRPLEGVRGKLHCLYTSHNLPRLRPQGRAITKKIK